MPFEFRGDWFNPTAIVAITAGEKTVSIYTYGDDNKPFTYGCDDADDAQEQQKQAVQAWRKALQEGVQP